MSFIFKTVAFAALGAAVQEHARQLLQKSNTYHLASDNYHGPASDYAKNIKTPAEYKALKEKRLEKARLYQARLENVDAAACKNAVEAEKAAFEADQASGSPYDNTETAYEEAKAFKHLCAAAAKATADAAAANAEATAAQTKAAATKAALAEVSPEVYSVLRDLNLALADCIQTDCKDCIRATVNNGYLPPICSQEPLPPICGGQSDMPDCAVEVAGRLTALKKLNDDGKIPDLGRHLSSESGEVGLIVSGTNLAKHSSEEYAYGAKVQVKEFGEENNGFVQYVKLKGKGAKADFYPGEQEKSWYSSGNFGRMQLLRIKKLIAESQEENENEYEKSKTSAEWLKFLQDHDSKIEFSIGTLQCDCEDLYCNNKHNKQWWC